MGIEIFGVREKPNAFCLWDFWFVGFRYVGYANGHKIAERFLEAWRRM